jgi:hypothetical protein
MGCPGRVEKINENKGIFGFFFYVLYSTLLPLPPLRFHCVGGCWGGKDRYEGRVGDLAAAPQRLAGERALIIAKRDAATIIVLSLYDGGFRAKTTRSEAQSYHI